MRILITGGAGYIGYELTEMILAGTLASDVYVYDNLSRKNYALFTHPGLINKNIHFIEGEILDGRKLKQALEGIDCVIHLAAKVTTPFADSDAHIFDQINHWGTAELINAVEKSDVKHFIYLSSTSVYGSNDETIDENTELNPHSFYGISKMKGESQTKRLGQEIKTHVIRSGNVYGYNPAIRIDAVINHFMFQAQLKGRISIHGDGNQSRSFIHLKKLCHVICGLIENNLPSQTLNVVEYNFTVNEIADHMKLIYPDLELLHMNQNMKMRNIRVHVPCEITNHIPFPEISFIEELKDFKTQFSF